MLDPTRTPDLIALICWWATERGSAITTIQVVKFLYLADLYAARRNSGQTLTAWPWAFVNFGPYCAQAMEAIDRAATAGVIAREARESAFHADKEYYLHRALGHEPALAAELPMLVLSPLRAAVKRWADDSQGLLDHVYFETEPMRGVNPFDRLDFRKCSVPVAPSKPVEPEKLSEKKLRKGRALIAALRDRTLSAAQTTPVDTGPVDDSYYQAVGHDAEPIDDGIEVRAGVLGLDSPDGEGE